MTFIIPAACRTPCTHVFILLYTCNAGIHTKVFADLTTRVEDSEGKYVVLAMDKMKVKEYLVYNKHTSQIVGFVNLGSTEQQLLALEQEERRAASPLATHVLQFMVRGICMHLD